LYFWHVGSVYCTSEIDNPTPLYVVEGREAVLQCGFESSRLSWRVYNGGQWNNIASAFDIIDKSKYNVSTNPSTGLYYRLHILNVGVSDVDKYRCQATINGKKEELYLLLILSGRCNYTSVIFKVWKIEGFIVFGESVWGKTSLIGVLRSLISCNDSWSKQCEIMSLRLRSDINDRCN
jgi:hypothetical protein